MNERWHAGNRVELLVNGEAFYPRVFEAIARARREVLLETFIIYEDKVGLALRKALLAAARRGVRVELIVDGYGTADLGTDYIGSLLEAGVRLHLFDPRPRLLGLRTNLFRRLHRKLLVVDGSTAFVGGINFSADHLADFGTMAKQDYAVLVQGPVAQDIRQASLALLEEYGSTPERLPPGLPSLAGETRACLVLRDNGPRSTAIERHYLAAIQRARRRLTIANAYFLVLRGVWGKSGLTVREAGRLAVAKRTNPHPLLSPCILLILLLSGQATKSSPATHLPTAPC